MMNDFSGVSKELLSANTLFGKEFNLPADNMIGFNFVFCKVSCTKLDIYGNTRSKIMFWLAATLTKLFYWFV